MVRLLSLSLLTVFASVALAGPSAEQQVLTGSPVRLAEKWTYRDCDKIDQISPDPPKPGHDLTVTVSATAVGTIEEGAYADVSVKLGRIKLLTKTFDVCEEARNANATVQCPVQEGDYEVSQTVALPGEIPPAKFNIDVKGYTHDDDDLLCLSLIVNFGPFNF
ncbi:hypothetical protein JVT61DRAFT_5648 [Boletus reticuloceps]|uniref:Phosphatidylglycerol/phosphatidylinositol transfer protein n=1 Tax=Boletus reticuloceps TaxID=495285 RepID=A0A8I2YXP5_9AGAM|nr:hypothetical protein JVT61DRAFT_5648 [Boletus reticuloceps]